MTAIGSLILRGTHAARPAASTPGILYFETDTLTTWRDNGASWDAYSSSGAGTRTLQLDYTLGSNITAAAIAAGAWTDLIVNQTFTVTSGTGTIAITASVGAFISPTSAMPAGDAALLQMAIDSASTNTQEEFGYTIAGASANYVPIAGSRVLYLTGLSAGSHTVKIRAHCDVAGTMNCRPVLQPTIEFARIQVLEWD